LTFDSLLKCGDLFRQPALSLGQIGRLSGQFLTSFVQGGPLFSDLFGRLQPLALQRLSFGLDVSELLRQTLLFLDKVLLRPGDGLGLALEFGLRGR